MKIKHIKEADLVVVGSGIGGLTAAKKASDKGLNVILVTSSKFCGGASYFPLKGTLGIQTTAHFPEDEKLFQEDINRVGLGMDNPHMVESYIKNIRESIGFLNEIGFEPWLRDDRRPACFAKYPRDIYLIKDWEKAKSNASKIFNSIENLKIEENYKIVKILQKNNCVDGAIFQDKNGDFLLIKTKVIVMATGGVAGLYKHNLYPEDVDGSGHIVALDAGAQVTNMEFIQFIPAFITPKYNTLYGEHTAKYVTGMFDLNGKLIYPGIDDEKARKLWIERSAYAPFSCDFESFKIDLAMVNSIDENNGGVELKFHPDLYKDSGEFYTVYLNWLKESMNIDMCKDKITIAPFAHGCNGGVMVDQFGKTSVDGLYAIGELSSSVEGANRLGGNSVGGALVFGNQSVLNAYEYLKNLENKDVKNRDTSELLNEFQVWISEIFGETDIKEDLLEKDEVVQKIKNTLTNYGLIKRNYESLKTGLDILENLKTKSLDGYFKIEAAKLLLISMINRNESRGAHYREDFPKRDSIPQRLVVSRKNNSFNIEK